MGSRVSRFDRQYTFPCTFGFTVECCLPAVSCLSHIPVPAIPGVKRQSREKPMTKDDGTKGSWGQVVERPQLARMHGAASNASTSVPCIRPRPLPNHDPQFTPATINALLFRHGLWFLISRCQQCPSISRSSTRNTPDFEAPNI